ncbi:Uma2 family endonuclease [Streptomyces sp. NPDC002676]
MRAAIFQGRQERTPGTAPGHEGEEEATPRPPAPPSARRCPSRNRDTDRRDRIDQVRGYAEAGIPIYLLIDRDNDTLVVHNELKDGRYQQSPSYPWGATVELPPPVGITLETEKLKDYAD